jgi:hypothetical protein
MYIDIGWSRIAYFHIAFILLEVKGERGRLGVIACTFYICM